ncbi:MAG: DNA-processing protein DprA [Pirellulales bacterium]
MTDQTAQTLSPDDAQLAAVLRLALVPGVGPRLRQNLLESFGTCQSILEASTEQLRRTPGIGAKLADRIAAARDQIDVEALLTLAARHGIDVLTESSDGYPRMLREIHDPPGVLFVHGQLQPVDALAIAIVGTRHASHYGRQQAERLAGSLARAGLTIVSGLARGIDAAAHRGALAAGGRTIAVLASGLLNIYPPEHVDLADEVRQHGAVVSEAPPRAQPLAGAFPQRNRLISGLSLGVIVVEAATRSGALITARHATEQGREVFAVPGRVDNRLAHGCHRLLRDGAKLVETADDVLEELGPLVEATPRDDGTTIHHPAELSLNDVEQQVLQAVGTNPTSLDAVIRTSGLPAPRVLSTVSVLEMRRLLRRVSGNQVMRG